MRELEALQLVHKAAENSVAARDRNSPLYAAIGIIQRKIHECLDNGSAVFELGKEARTPGYRNAG